MQGCKVDCCRVAAAYHAEVRLRRPFREGVEGLRLSAVPLRDGVPERHDAQRGCGRGRGAGGSLQLELIVNATRDAGYDGLVGCNDLVMDGSIVGGWVSLVVSLPDTVYWYVNGVLVR